MPSYAHTHPDHPDDSSHWEPLFTPWAEDPARGARHRRASNHQPSPAKPARGCTGKDAAPCPHCEALAPQHGHLNKVAWHAAKFAADMFPPGPDRDAARQWAYLAGLWHDLGKFAPEWQTYLASKADPHLAEATGKPSKKEDHSTAGAKHAAKAGPLGPLISYLIAGHHAGLADGHELFPVRLRKAVNDWLPQAETAGVPLDESLPMPPLRRPEAGNDAMAFLLRFFFSCLVDADFLATESFMRPEHADLRQPWPGNILERITQTLEDHMARKFGPPGDDPVNLARESVRLDCLHAADHPPGFFSLTVPTGGGKTLASLLFALRHALKNGHRRVILVIPFTSIIKQNADVFREAFAPLSKELGREIVLEHHSKFDPARETETNRLATENWDSPLIVTTNVRFFESLFANRSGTCRKLHRIARSVVIFDEVQALPSGLLNPILRALRCLVHDLHATAVLCTATQPALEQRDQFAIGIPPAEITEIVREKSQLFDALERVTCENLGPLTDDKLIPQILDHADGGCLVIVNTTKAAQSLHQQLSQLTPTLHLSARMCPRHVMLILARAKRLRKHGQPVVLVATQLVEAGVDISFPVVYRAECGLDSFAQAAGRCNRHGELLPRKGRVFLFQPTDHPIPSALADLKANAGITRTQIADHFPGDTLLSLPAIRSYFEHAIWHAGLSTRWDKHSIVSGDACFSPESKTLTAYSFKTAARKFRLIDSDTHSVLIPWGPKGRALENEIRQLSRLGLPPRRSHYRRAQQFTVQIYDHEWQQLKPSLSLHCDEAFAILDHHQNDYHPHTGLKRPGTAPDPSAFFM